MRVWWVYLKLTQTPRDLFVFCPCCLEISLFWIKPMLVDRVAMWSQVSGLPWFYLSKSSYFHVWLEKIIVNCEKISMSHVMLFDHILCNQHNFYPYTYFDLFIILIFFYIGKRYILIKEVPLHVHKVWTQEG